ncbi:unnamed protein product, partial [Tetraodon nigroviridis]
ASRLEINFIRLLSRCESIASEKRGETEWRLEKFVAALEEMLVALRKSHSKPTAEVLTEYTRKVDFLKGLLEAEKLVSWVSDVSIRLCWICGDVPGSHVCPVLCQPSPTDKALANQFLAPGRTPTIGHERMSATKTVHMQTKGRCTAQMRSELLDTVGADGGCSRCSQHRNGCTAAEITTDRLAKQTVRLATSPLVPWLFPLSLYMRLLPCPSRGLPLDERQSAAELEAVLQHHHSLQEKLAEDMLHLARNLKNNTLAAHSIIKQDNQTLGQSMRQADMNLEKLKTESERLEQHTKKSINWLLWLMLILVSFIFISMILFIRIFPRLR